MEVGKGRVRGPRNGTGSLCLRALTPPPPDSWGPGLWAALLLPMPGLSILPPPALPVPTRRQSLVTGLYLVPANAEV